MRDATITRDTLKGHNLLDTDTDAEFTKGGLAPKAPSPVGSGFPKLNPGGGDCVPGKVDPGDDVVGVGKDVGLLGACVVGVMGVVGEEEDEDADDDG